MSSALFQQIVDATRGEYVPHGTLGESDVLGSAFLAQEVATGRSVLLIVPPSAESLDVVGALSDSVPADAGGCAACGFRVNAWVDACPRCEHVMLPPADSAVDAASLREQLRGTIDVVGSVPHVRGGTMYFGHETDDTRLTAFVIRPQPDGQLALDVIWDAADAGAPAAPEPAYAASTPAGAGGYAEPVTASPADPDGDDTAAAPAALVAADDTPRPRRALPIALGVGALALVGAAAFAFTRGSSRARTAPVTGDTAKSPYTLIAPSGNQGVTGVGPSTTGTPNGSNIAATAGTGGTAVAVINRDSVLRDSALRDFRRRRRDSLRVLRAQLATGPQITIDGDLPTGWSLSVNGAGATTNRSIHLTAGQPTVIRIQAPGYCPDTLLITPSGRDDKHWAPTLQGKPLRGEC